MNDISSWLESLAPTIPWTGTKQPPKASQLTALIQLARERLSQNQIALLWLRIAELDRSHEIAQADKSSMGSYLHGIVHRLEGDYWNANYWFDRVGEPQLLRAIGSRVRESSDTRQIDQLMDLGVLIDDHFSPSGLVALCEISHRKKLTVHIPYIESIAFVEWQMLWERLTSATDS
jgi:hypothetical protein